MTIDAWADFNTDRTHRYSLGRRWSAWDPRAEARSADELREAPAHLRYLVVIGLNPSIADADRLDPTVTRIKARAIALGYGGLVMLNLFSLVSTDPRGLRTVDFADGGPRNLRTLVEWCTSPLAGMVLAAWGADPFAVTRAGVIRDKLEAAGVQLHALGFTRHGAPRHPLYLPYSAQPRPWLRVGSCGMGPAALPSPGTLSPPEDG